MDVLPVGVVSMRDASGSVGYTRIGIVSGASASAALSALWGLAGLLASASDAVPAAVAVTYRTVVSDARPPSGSDAGQQLVLVFSTTEPGEYGVVKVGGAPDDMFGPDGGAIPGDVRVDALADELIAGPWTNPFGYSLSELLTAFKGDSRE